MIVGMVLYEINSDPVTGNHITAAIGETLVSIGFAFTLPLWASGPHTPRISWATRG